MPSHPHRQRDDSKGFQPDASTETSSFRTLLDISPELALIHREGTVVYANPAVARALGFDAHDQFIGMPLLELFHPQDREDVTLHLMGCGAPAPPEPFGLRWKRYAGGYRTTEAVTAAVTFQGEPAVVVVARDVTERVEFQHEFMQRDRMAALATLSAGVAHGINNPLTYLVVNLDHVLRRLRVASASDDPCAELFMRGSGGGLPALVESLQQALEGAGRVRQIIRDLLTFSQGNVDHRGITDVRGIVESALQMASHEIRHRARLVKSFAEVPPVDANEARLGHVFLNLLVNAAQAIPEGSADVHEIRVSTRTDDRGNAVIEVTDSGTGIAPDDLPHIFDPFFTTKGEAGMGLGLAISHGMVRALGGDIDATSRAGAGTTFRVVLPPAKTWRGAAASSVRDLRAATRRRVLVIDDDALVAHAIARALSDDNDVAVVTDAQQALTRVAAGERYDVLLCDLMMPVVTGMDLYAEVVRCAPELARRIVFMTGGAFTPRSRAFLESVVNQWVEKPIDMGKLRSIIAHAGRD
ncbi:MAG: ATP-binding protein [Myxococcota bacterium]|nr:ATP-binding protein [Myxococcota bacterium]